MNELVWRLHRDQVRFAVAVFGVVAIVLAITGPMVSHGYHGFLTTCTAAQSCVFSSQVFSKYFVFSDLTVITIAVPGLFGLFWGAPLLGREFEENTHTFVWTQGVTRRQWLNSTIGWALLASALWGGAMAAIVSWWRAPETAAFVPGPRLQPGLFDIQGIVPVAYALFAVAVGIAAGALIRRVLPSLGVTLAVFAGLRVAVVNYVRPHLLPPVTKLVTFGTGFRIAATGKWLLSRFVTGTNGQRIHLPYTVLDFPAACRPGSPASGAFRGVPACLGAHGWHELVTYQPPSRFWAFQGMEAGIFIALAAVIVAMTYRLVLKRDA